MSVWSWATSGSAWANTTEQTISSVACRVKKVEIYSNQSQSGTAYVHLYDATNPTPGTTAPLLTFSIGSQAAVSGTEGLKRKHDFILPNGGRRFGTALTIFCSSDGGATAPLTTVIPLEIKVYYEPES